MWRNKSIYLKLFAFNSLLTVTFWASLVFLIEPFAFCSVIKLPIARVNKSFDINIEFHQLLIPQWFYDEVLSLFHDVSHRKNDIEHWNVDTHCQFVSIPDDTRKPSTEGKTGIHFFVITNWVSSAMSRLPLKKK